MREVKQWYAALHDKTAALADLGNKGGRLTHRTAWTTMTYWNCFEYGQGVFSPGAPPAKWCPSASGGGFPPGPHPEW